MNEMAGRITVSVSDEDYTWLKEHPEIKVSGLVQRCIRDLRSKYE